MRSVPVEVCMNVTGVDVNDQRHISVTESAEDKRVQRFVCKGLGPAQIRERPVLP